MAVLLSSSAIFKLISGIVALVAVPVASYYFSNSSGGPSRAPEVTIDFVKVDEDEDLEVSEGSGSDHVEGKADASDTHKVSGVTIEINKSHKNLEHGEWRDVSARQSKIPIVPKKLDNAWTLVDKWNICRGGGILGDRVICTPNPSAFRYSSAD